MSGNRARAADNHQPLKMPDPHSASTVWGIISVNNFRVVVKFHFIYYTGAEAFDRPFLSGFSGTFFEHVSNPFFSKIVAILVGSGDLH